MLTNDFLSNGAAVRVPPDGRPVNITNTYNLGLVITLDILATAGIVFAVVCLLFNIIFRNRRYLLTATYTWSIIFDRIHCLVV